MSLIDETDINTSFNCLIRLVLENCRIGYVEHQGCKYFNRQNQWNDCEQDCNDKNSCLGYWDCEFLKRIKPKDDISYFLRMDVELVDTIEDKQENKRMANLINRFGWDTPLFESSLSTITLVNSSGFNDDHRGSDHTKLILDFNNEWTVKGNRFVDFAEAVFRIKSHKFDTWYEMFCESHSESNLTGDKFVVMCEFDHGS